MARRRSPRAESIEHHGHKIALLKSGDGEPVLLIDGERIRYGQDDGGLYYLSPYAYDRDESLLEVVRRYVEYRDRAAEIRSEQGA
jgi:hypothetical protein